jgi:ribosomal protein S27AE
MKNSSFRDRFWPILGAACFLVLLILSFAPGIPDQWQARKRLYGFLGVVGAAAVGYGIADRLELIPRPVPRKCPKCGVRLTSFKKNYPTGEVTCGRCGQSFFVRKGRVVK